MINSKDKKFEIILNQGKELLQFYRENPCIALYDLLGVDLAPIQRLLFNDMWFKNYVIGICSRGLGKSVSCNSLAYLKDSGLIYLNEELPKIPSYLNDEEDITIDFKNLLYTSKGFRNINKLCLEKNIKGKKLTTKNNFIHEGSNQHPLLTIDNNGKLIYKMSEDFKVGNSICILSGQKIFTDNKIDKDDAYLVGLLLSESMVIDDLGNVSILINDDKVLNFCKVYCFNNNVNYKCYKNKKILNTYGFIFENFNSFINKYKIQSVNRLKSVPKIIRTSSKISQINFFKGYYSINDITNNKYLVVCCSASKKLLREIQMMMLNFGVITKVYKEGKGLYIIEVLQDSIEIFNKEIFGRGSNVTKKYYIDTIKSVEDWVGDCYDFMMDMEEEPNYFANGFINHNTYLLGALATLSSLLFPGHRVGLIGPSFRQSRMIFSEVEKIYDQSPILREAVQKKPTRHTDSCFLKFKAIGGVSGSFIEALPLGVDGSKIRGSRFYTICIDELAQVPSKIVDLVIRPFAATTLSPMENVRQKEQQRKLIELGIATEGDFEDKKVNKMIVMSSGYYKFNHIWKRMQDHWSMVDKEGENSRYSVWQIPYTDLPDGFLDNDNIQESKRIMSTDEFRMEYEAEMISDSEGFFKASLLESCTTNSGHTVELIGKSKSSYILGVDPNQAGSAGCGIVIIKLGEVNRVVKCINLRVDTTQKIATCIQSICSQFKITRIFMDKGGGGKAVCDLLEEGYNDKEPIIDITNVDHINMKGRHILEMVVFTPSWISDANFTTKALLESNSLLFPEAPVGSTKDEAGEIFEDVDKLKSQMRSIVVTQTPSGLLHFDTPKKHQNKDLYSALILLGYGIKFLLKEQEKSLAPVLHNAGGLVKGMEPGSSWQQHQSGGVAKISDMAILNRKK